MTDREIDGALAELERDGLIEQLPNGRFRLTETGRTWVESLLETDPAAREFMAAILDRKIAERGGSA